ncbi:hypothetical protein Tco_0608224 [Tanacetum coccineum]
MKRSHFQGAEMTKMERVKESALDGCMHRLNESFEFSNSSQPRQVVGILRNPFSQSDASLTTRMKPIKVNEIFNVMGFADVNTHIQVKKNAHPYLGDGCAMDGKQIPSPTFADMEANSTSFGELKTISEMNPSSKLGRDDDKEARSPIMPMKKSFVNMVADTKSVPKVNFRTLNNDEKVDDSDFVLPMDVITRAQNKFANLIVGYLARKTIAFILVKNYVGHLGFARALIEVGVDKELKQEVTMAISYEDGTRHTKEKIRIEYEWTPLLCLECHVFGHTP